MLLGAGGEAANRLRQLIEAIQGPSERLGTVDAKLLAEPNWLRDPIVGVLTGRKAVILDWDGTIVDNQSRNYQVVCDALAPYQVTIEQDWYRRHCGLPIYELLSRLDGAEQLPLPEIIEASRRALLTSTTPDTLRPNTAVIGLAKYANCIGLRCAIASGASSVLVNAGIDALGLRALFHAVVTRDDVAHGKPAPDTFLEAASRLGVDPAACVAVDDARDGIQAARTAGMRVLTIGENLQLAEVPASIGNP
ncbi:HAD family phosphatase [Nocardia sp. NPDC049220]|uniref:HAD family hydrolase n=1 Tax=Nocardia sp. NPDC049220 TaxID=3155273 RepID=UPI0033F0FA9D